MGLKYSFLNERRGSRVIHGFLCDLAGALTSSPLCLGRGEGAGGREEDREGQEAEEEWGQGDGSEGRGLPGPPTHRPREPGFPDVQWVRQVHLQGQSGVLPAEC